ncbi:MAG: thiamine-phosphate kinase [Candidatus Korarchaeum sp.]|nr:thiamine-phosphate kinase [Candidatus Korarchaeum sp.]MDW8036056.1 thiamine-phosphate kinase [Candidatus Korarchaeum sp.]
MRPERELVDEIVKIITEDPEELLKLGRDDASARELKRGVYIFKMDMVTSSTDLLPGMSLSQLAKKCVTANFSDIASKGGRPVLFMSSLGLPRKLTDEDFLSIFRGLEEAMRRYGTYLVGGDLSESKEIVISGFAFGKVEGKLVGRNGAKPGDILMTTGSFGLTWLGFKHLLEGLDVPDQLKEDVLRAVYEPEAKVEEGIVISRYATSTIDSSDGLYWSLKELSRASGHGFLVEELPLDERVKEYLKLKDADIVEAAFHGGEEYEIVFTVREELIREVTEELEPLGLEPLRIGRVIEREGVYLRIGNDILEVPEGGWEHFRELS